ncbi:MAG TPA: tryptophan synthase subunit alpha [Limnochordia bacterium]
MSSVRFGISDRLHRCWEAVRATGRKALIPYVTGGDPDLETTGAALQRFAESGADVIEVGFPFSDPIADGPVIQRAVYRALSRGVNVPRIFEAVHRVRGSFDQPLVALVYYNSVFDYGEARFCQEARQAGFDGLMIPDLPLEEAESTHAAAAEAGLDLIYLAAPTTPDERLAAIAARATSFIYAISVTGVTGVRDTLPARVETFLRRLRSVTDRPVAVGFGIGSGREARRLAPLVDGIIVGSATVDRLSRPDGLEVATQFVRELRAALDGVEDPVAGDGKA